MADGLWASLAVLLVALPFALALNPLASALHALGEPSAHVGAFFALALPWGLVSLLLMPHCTAAFAATGKPRDMLKFAASLSLLRHNFITTHVDLEASVTGPVIVC